MNAIPRTNAPGASLRSIAFRAATGIAGILVALLFTSCSKTISGHAIAHHEPGSRPGDPFNLFNPCAPGDMTDDMVRKAGLDPATKGELTDPPTGPSTWRGCHWDSADGKYFIGVLSTMHTVEESNARDNVTDLREVTIGSRSGVTYHQPFENPAKRCTVVFPAEQGSFHLVAEWVPDEKPRVDPCTAANDYASKLEPMLPK